jgi:hypothetical protein
MSTRLTRILRRLYPRSVRERYGDELLDLQRELRERGEISRAGLIRDAIAGAILARSSGRRAFVTVSAVTVLAVLALSGGLIAGGSRLGSSRSASGAPLAIAKIAPRPLPGHVCLVSGSPCSLPPCTHYIVVMNPTTGDIVSATPAVAADQAARCAASPTLRPHVLPVGT